MNKLSFFLIHFSELKIIHLLLFGLIELLKTACQTFSFFYIKIKVHFGEPWEYADTSLRCAIIKSAYAYHNNELKIV